VNRYIDSIDSRLTTFPYIPLPVKSKGKVDFLLIGDSDFRREEVIEAEPEDEFK
jgi:hypothetical protein